MPETTVKDSLRNIVEIATATIISFNRITEEVTGEIFFKPLDQRRYGTIQQNIAV